MNTFLLKFNTAGETNWISWCRIRNLPTHASPWLIYFGRYKPTIMKSQSHLPRFVVMDGFGVKYPATISIREQYRYIMVVFKGYGHLVTIVMHIYHGRHLYRTTLVVVDDYRTVFSTTCTKDHYWPLLGVDITITDHFEPKIQFGILNQSIILFHTP